MELQILFTLLVLFVSFLIYLFTKLHNSSNNNLPPQPWKLPVIGHLHHLAGSIPHRALGNLAEKHGPIIHLQLGEFSAVIISSPELAKEVMKTHDLNFANRPKLISAEIIAYNYKDIAFAPYGEYWRQMRKICILELLSAKKVKSFASVREQESWNLIESLMGQTTSPSLRTGSKTVNLSEKIFTMMNAITLKVAVGSRYKDEAALIALMTEILLLSSGFDLSDLFPSIKVLHLITGMRKKMMKMHHKLDKILDDIISDHQQQRARVAGKSDQNEDILDVLLRLKDDGGLPFPLTYDHVKATIMDMFLAGTDTSSVTIDWAMSELIKNPKVMKKAQTELRHVLQGKDKIYESDIQELDYFKLVIKETLRLHPPAPLLIPRESREKCDIGGYHIPANTKVIINGWKIGMDPDHWNDPKRFIPERFIEKSVNRIGTDFEYLPFGAGRRMCPGMILGLANVELPLARLLYHFNWELPNGVSYENIDMSETLGATLSRKHDLHLVPIAYNTN